MHVYYPKYYSVFDKVLALSEVEALPKGHDASTVIKEYNRNMTKFLRRFFQVLPGNDTGSARSAASKAIPGVGATIADRYRLDAEIGRGGMGIVYRAYDLVQERNVAIKVINFDQANALTRQQFAQEVGISAVLKHPHIVEVYEAGVIEVGMPEPLPFLVMEWVQGTSLDQLGSLTYARILDIARQICEALEYAHEQGFVYRDLKPANVLIEKCGFDYSVKLTDFGLARPRGTNYLDLESSLAGSVFYLAPELVVGQPADIGSDLYALGVTLYEMVTGRVPFANFDERFILVQHLEAPVTPPSQSRPDVPPALEAIILRLLAKDPGERFASTRDVREALEQVSVTRERGTALGNLPHPPVTLSGQEDKVAQGQRLLEANQLVTLLSKDDALALAIAAQAADQFTDGVWYVDLGMLDDPSLVLETVASVLGVCRDPQRPLAVTVVEHLQEKNLLLLLSHCSHLLRACAQLAEILLRTCPDVRILATSRDPLNLAAEKVHAVH